LRGNRLGFLKAALQTDRQGEVLAHAAIGTGRGCGLFEIGFCRSGITGQKIGHSHIGDDRRFIRLKLQRLLISRAGFFLPAHLVEDGTLRGNQLPVGIGRVLSAANVVERAVKLARSRKRLAIGCKNSLILRVDDGERPHDRQRLIVAAKAAQHIGIVERGLAILRIAFIFCAKPPGHCSKLRVVHVIESRNRCRAAHRACRRPVNRCAAGKNQC